MTRSLPQWQALSAALLITKDDLDPDEVTRGLGVRPDFSRLPGEEPGFREGAGCWVLRCEAPEAAERHEEPGEPSGLSALLGELLPRIATRSDELAALRAAGYRVQVDIVSRVGRGGGLFVSPEVLRRVSRLGLPLSFTAETGPGAGAAEEDTGDFFDWLGPATGSHRA